MPELITHYAVSLLISSRVISLRYASLLTLIGLLPDIDALFRIHRWFTHSIVITSLIFTAAYLIIQAIKPKMLKYLITTYLLYILHIILDVFTAPTPILWPVTLTSYMLKVGVDGVISVNGITITPNIALNTKSVDFTQKAFIEGPIITESGVIIAVLVITTIIMEHLMRKYAY